MTIDLSAYKPTPETGGDANAISNAFTAIEAILNGGVDATAFAAGKIFDPLKLTQDGAVPGQALVWSAAANGGMGGWVPGGSALYRKTTAKQIVNTTAEIDLLNGEMTLGANVLGASGRLRLTVEGDLANNTGGSVVSPRFKLKLGATTLLDSGGGASVGSSASRYAWKVVCEIQNLGAANAQWASMFGGWTGAVGSVSAAAFVTGAGYSLSDLISGGVGIVSYSGGNSTAVDTTASNALVFSAILGTASAAYDITLKDAIVEIL